MPREREAVYDADITKLICDFEEYPEAYEAEEITPNHYMKNTIKIRNGFEADCSLLGLNLLINFVQKRRR
jgi:hypothetical protein